MRKSKRRQRHSLPFGLFLAVVGALLLPLALAPRANAEVDANFSWVGFTAAGWNNPGNWSPSGGPPGPGDTAVFNQAFPNQPNLTTGVTVGTVWMTTGVVQNVTISGPGTLSLSGLGILGTGILVDNPNTATLTITANVGINNSQAWTNNSGNLFTVSGNVALGGNAVTVNGTGDTLISGNVSGMGSVSDLNKDGSGTLTLTGTNTYGGGTAVNGGTLLVDNTSGVGTGTGAVTVSNAGTTLGGTGTIGTTSVGAGANIAPGNGGNNTGILTTGALTLAFTSNFRVDINGTTAGTGYDQINVAAGGVTITGSNLVVTVGTTLSLGQTFTILNKTAGGAITGTFAGIPQGGTVVGSDGTVFSVSYTGGNGNDIVLTVIAGGGPRTEHMDGRRACDRWARFHAAPQIAQADSAAHSGKVCPRNTLKSTKESS